MMRIGKIIIGVAGIGLAVLLCAPLAITVWATTYFNPIGSGELRLSDGSGALSGWQMWLFVAVLASFGGGIFVFSIYALISKKDDT